VIVVDNNSTDATHQTVEEIQAGNFPFSLRYVLEPRQGVAYARNRGLDEAAGKYIAYMDDDQLIDKNYLSRLGPAFQSTQAVCVGGRIFYYEMGSLPSWLPTLLEGVGHLDYGDDVKILDANGGKLRGGYMAMKREELVNIGKYEVSLGRCGDSLLGGEEDELQERLHAAKKTIAYDPGLIQYHYFDPARLTKTFWRRHHFDLGRSLYRKSLLRSTALGGPSFLGAPRWLWRHLVTRDIPRAAWAFTSLNAAEIFDKQLDVWTNFGRIRVAREQSAMRKRQ
jgi:glycosyltransferase involved in cell wall biosynthesis